MTRRGTSIARAGGPQEQAGCAPLSGDTLATKRALSERQVANQASGDRDSWCTPSWLTDLLPPVGLDPCSNARSTVAALKTYRLDRGEDGLSLPWAGSVFVNPPYSDVKPWAEKLLASSDVTAAAFLVNLDASTAWWRLLSKRLTVGLFFYRRVQFSPPPGVKASTNSKPQVLLMDSGFFRLVNATPLLKHGAVWSTERQVFASGEVG